MTILRFAAGLLTSSPSTPPPINPPILTAPDTTGYTVINIPTSGYTSTLNHDTDYVFQMPDEPVTDAVWIKGGRNVVMIGGEIKIDTVNWSTPPGASESDQQAIYIIRHPSAGVHAGGRIVHIEGVKMHGYYLSDGIRTAANDGGPVDVDLQIVNCRIELGMWYRDSSSASGNQGSPHPDLIQPFGGLRTLNVDGFTGLSTGQGFQISEDLNTMDGPHTFRRVNLRENTNPNTEYNDPAAPYPRPPGDDFRPRYLWWTDSSAGEYRIEDGSFWINHPTRNFDTIGDELFWPEGPTYGSNATGTYAIPAYTAGYDGTGDGYIYEGIPLGGDYVTTAGVDYDPDVTPPPPPSSGEISFVGVVSDSSNDATELAIDLEALPTQADDFAVLFYYSDDGNTGTYAEVDTPSGWILEPGFPEAYSSTRRRKVWLFTRRLTGGADINPSLDRNNGANRPRSAVLAVYRGVDTVTGLDTAAVASGGLNTATPTIASITTVTANAAIVQCLAMTHDPAPVTAPDGYDLLDFAKATSWHGASAMAHLLDAGGPGVKTMTPWTTSEGSRMDWAGATIALRPA